MEEVQKDYRSRILRGTLSHGLRSSPSNADPNTIAREIIN
jgi:hypothetical protein